METLIAYFDDSAFDHVAVDGSGLEPVAAVADGAAVVVDSFVDDSFVVVVVVVDLDAVDY